MNRFVSTFITGLQDVVSSHLTKTFPDVDMVLLLDGLIVYQGEISLEDVKKVRFFNNTFIVLRYFQRLGKDPIQEMLRLVANDKALPKKVPGFIRNGRDRQTFRLIASYENQTVPMDKKLRAAIESKLASRTLVVNRHRPDLEFWFLYRSEGVGFFLLRLTDQKGHKQRSEKGELRPELAHCLCLISEPQADDVFLDPFCGQGAIPVERALAFPYNMIFAGDGSPAMVSTVKGRLKSERGLKKKRIQKTFFVKQQDALRLETFEDNFIHKIVTDPPWGHFESLETEVTTFYFQMLQAFCRVVKPGGLMVILTAKKDEFEDALSRFPQELSLSQKYDILVSGKKAAVYKLEKR